MRSLRERAFGHPVLRAEGGEGADYRNRSFAVRLERADAEARSGGIVVQYEMEVKSEHLLGKIKEGHASRFLRWECPETYISRTCPVGEKGNLPIPTDDVTGSVELTPLVLAKRATRLSSTEFHEEFGGREFHCPSGAVLAHGPRVRFRLKPTRGGSSIFRHRSSPRVKEDTFEVELQGPYIHIYFHPSDFARAKNPSASYRDGWNAIVNSVLLPTTYKMLCHLQDMNEEERAEDNRPWVQSVLKQLDAKGFTGWDEKESNLLLIAQKLLDKPFGNLGKKRGG